MSELFLHIGSHKTGTTSIQRACSRLSDFDELAGIKYLNLRPGGTRVVKTGGKLAEFRAKILLDAADQVFRAEAGKRYVASDESFFWISEPETVHEFAALLQQRFSTVTVLCYLRRQDLLALSHRKQVSDGMPAAQFYGLHATPLPQYQPHFQTYFNYAAKLSTLWASAFGKANIQVISYDEIARAGGDVAADFTHRIGIPPALIPALCGTRRANRSRKGNKTLVGLKLIELGIPAENRRKILEALPGAGKFLPSRVQAQEFLAHFAEANQQLAQDWTYQGAAFAFDSSFDMYPDANNACWSHGEVEKIIEAIINGMHAPSTD